MVAGGSPTLRYQWRLNGVNLAGATNATFTITNAQATDAGAYSVRVANGLGSATSPDAILTVIASPVVTVVASDPSATEPGADTGAFTLRRAGNVALPLTVIFQITGSAVPGSDYQALSSPITFGAGVASRVLGVSPLDDATREGNETVILSLLAGPSYIVGAPSNATVTLRDDDNRAPFVTLTNPPDGERFTAPVNVLLGAAAGDSDGLVVRVEFFDGTNRIGEATSAPSSSPGPTRRRANTCSPPWPRTTSVPPASRLRSPSRSTPRRL